MGECHCGDVEGLACPVCAGVLVSEDGHARCVKEGRIFPLFGTIPCLVPEPALFSALWRSRLTDYREVTTLRIRQLRTEHAQPDLLPSTRQRLERLIDAKEHEIRLLPRLCAPLLENTSGREVPSRSEAGGNRLALFDCYEHVFRDWAWGGAESERLVSLVAELVHEPLERLAIYGAGPARFAVDLQRALGPERTFALDINPLPFFVAERLFRGDVLELDEYPRAPTSVAQAVVRQRLACETPPGHGFQLLLADALVAPFAPESLSAVVAPWFVDVCGSDLRDTMAGINGVLRPGGLFVLLGPLDFNTVLSRTYSFEETQAAIAEAGFEVTTARHETLPYFDSPHSGSFRRETVYLILARKRRAAPPRARGKLLAPWIEDARVPLPPGPHLAALGRTSMFTAMVLSQVDGTRSIVDIAAELAPTLGIGAETLTHELRAFFSKLPPS